MLSDSGTAPARPRGVFTVAAAALPDRRAPPWSCGQSSLPWATAADRSNGIARVKDFMRIVSKGPGLLTHSFPAACRGDALRLLPGLQVGGRVVASAAGVQPLGRRGVADQLEG